jgi:hypothetical protein
MFLSMSQNFLTNPPVEMVSKELEGALDNSYDDELDNTATLFIKFSDRTLKVTGNLSALTCVRGCVKELRLDNVKKRDALVALNLFSTRDRLSPATPNNPVFERASLQVTDNQFVFGLALEMSITEFNYVLDDCCFVVRDIT